MASSWKGKAESSFGKQIKPYLSLHFRQCRGQYISEPVSSKVRAELLDILKELPPHTLKTFVPGCISKDNRHHAILLPYRPFDVHCLPPSDAFQCFAQALITTAASDQYETLSQVFVSGAEVTTPPLLIRQRHLQSYLILSRARTLLSEDIRRAVTLSQHGAIAQFVQT